MDNEALNRYITKLKEDIRNIKYQINSIFQDIQKDKKQSYIEKRIDRLIDNYKNRYEKYQVISGLDKEEIVKMQGVLMNIGEKVELVCQVGSKDIEKQNTKLDIWKTEDNLEQFVYVSNINDDSIINMYGANGELELIYVDNNRKERTRNQMSLTKNIKKRDFLIE